MSLLIPVKTELKRGAALPLAVVLAAGTSLVLVTNSDEWLGRWNGLANQFRVYLILLAPFAVAAGAWMGARDTRRNIRELVSTTPRPAWIRLAAVNMPLMLASVVGSAVGLAMPAYLVSGIATYAGGGWPLTLAVSVLTLFAATTTGIVIGRTISHPVVGTAVAIALFTGAQQLLGHLPGDIEHLSPAQWQTDDFERFSVMGYIGQVVFIVGTLIALSMFYAAKPWQGAFMLAVAGAAASVLLSSAPGDLWEQDVQAKEPVCAGSAPEVCVTRSHAFALDSLAQGLHRIWAPLVNSQDLPAILVEPSAAKAKPGSVRLTDDATVLSDIRGHVDLDLDWRYNFFSNVLVRTCETSARTEATDEAATALLAGGSPYRLSSEAKAFYEATKRSSSADRSAVLSAYVSQRMRCVESPDWVSK